MKCVPLADARSLRFRAWVFLSLLFLSFFASGVYAAPAVVGKDVFLSQLLAARGFETENSAQENAASILKSGIVPEAVTNLAAPATRLDVLRWMIHSLGLAAEARILSGLELPFKDVKSLSPFEKGCLVVATRMNPPLFKSSAPEFGAAHQIAPDEAQFLLSNVRRASQHLKLEVSFSPTPGMDLEIYREGTFSGIPKWRVFVDGFDEKAEVDQLQNFFASQGFKMKSSNPNYEWRLGSELLEDYARVRHLVALARDRGKSCRVFASIKNTNLENQPLYWALLTVDPFLYVMEPVIAPGGITTLAPLSSMLRDSSAKAAINAGFFALNGRNKGSPIGTLKIGRTLVNKPYQGRTCLGWNKDNRAAFGEVSWNGQVRLKGDRLNGDLLTVNFLNYLAKGNAVVLYNTYYGKPTPTHDQVTEIVVEDGVCVSVNSTGGTALGPGRSVVAGYGVNGRILAERLQAGDEVWIESTLNNGDPRWNDMDDIIQAGPFLISNGAIKIESEGFSASLLNLRHPRSVIGLTGGGKWAFFVGDGRDGMHSVGFTLQEVAAILKMKGVAYALNLDGGGSTEMIIENKIFNSPSEKRERPISYGVGVKLRSPSP
ncbi:MAG: phosphodiester glycosidase family protein [Synergistaceae bacterium]|jgi:exopolysaccharide biosynthesis protein|nr:phosphodiester glycosidase family protein [Synergistaceae bacterium]